MTHISSMTTRESLTPLGLHSQLQTRTQVKSNPRVLTRMKEGSVGPALAEGTSSVEPDGKAEIATATKSEALVPWAKGEAKREVDVPLQGSPNEGKHRGGREAL